MAEVEAGPGTLAAWPAAVQALVVAFEVGAAWAEGVAACAAVLDEVALLRTAAPPQNTSKTTHFHIQKTTF